MLADLERALAQRLSTARRVTVLTGAGISAESGLRTFRGATNDDLPPDMRSLWKEFDPQTLATPEAFEADPALVSRWYDHRRIGCLAAIPNPGHVALAGLQDFIEAQGGRFVLLTQNVDRLHHRAGSRNVVELHGSIIEWRCAASGATLTPDPAPFGSYPVPSPFREGALLRPDVVWFGERLPEAAVHAANGSVEDCDVFIAAGTSSVVFPAAGLIHRAGAEGAYTAEVNAEATPISRAVDCSIRGNTGDVLPRVLKAAMRLSAGGA
jgi:NAD-dependent deacetylase